MTHARIERNDPSDIETVHGTAVSVDGKAVLLRGAPGSGKSDLALRLIDMGAELISDDQTILERRDGHLYASAPPSLAGLLEVRGIGILNFPYRDEAPLALTVDLIDSHAVERLPEEKVSTLNQVELPLCSIAAFEASAPLKIRLALQHGVGIAP